MGRRIWVELFSCVVILKSVMRQGDTTFVSLLHAVRNGELTEEHMELLRTVAVDECCGEERCENKLTMHMAAAWEKVEEACEMYFRNRAEPYATICAQDTVVYEKMSERARKEGRINQLTMFNTSDVELMRSYVRNPSVEAVKKSPPLLRVFVGSRVVLTTSIRGGKLVRYGIYNGAQGTVKEVVTDKDGEVAVVLVAFDAGEDGHIPRVVPIIRETARIAGYEKRRRLLRGLIVVRHMFPLRNASALTIHKAQGMSLDSACVHFVGMRHHAMPYVGMSRARTIEGLQVCGLPSSADDFNKKYGMRRSIHTWNESMRLESVCETTRVRHEESMSILARRAKRKENNTGTKGNAKRRKCNE